MGYSSFFTIKYFTFLRPKHIFCCVKIPLTHNFLFIILTVTNRRLPINPPKCPGILLSCYKKGGVRVGNAAGMKGILDAGSRASNLRVDNLNLAYQRQGLGFTSGCFSPRETQDIHVHGMLEI